MQKRVLPSFGRIRGNHAGKSPPSLVGKEGIMLGRVLPPSLGARRDLCAESLSALRRREKEVRVNVVNSCSAL